ncbi:mucin-12-like [Gracilinanus agilis]|uniref:mucin-12-like n=1 Tax=Gracilinanus agilis TaxID=191870 RepID=UPI001CFDFBCB|nr:mucin-12-like [Gracilinanus agilis]
MQGPDFSDTSSSQQVTQVPSMIHAVSLSKSSQVSASLESNSSTVCLAEVPSFPGPFSSRESMQVPDFSDISLTRVIIKVPSIHNVFAMNKSTQVPSFSDTSLSTTCTEDISSFSSPISSSESIQVPEINLPREVQQIPSIYSTKAICKSTQVPSFSSQSSSTSCIEDTPPLLVLSTESLQVPDFANISSTENKQVSYTSVTISTRKSAQVPPFYGTSSSSTGIGDISSFIVTASSKESKQVPDSSNKISTKLVQVSLASDAISVSKPPQVYSSLTQYTSNKSIQYSSHFCLISLNQTTQVSFSTGSTSKCLEVPSLSEPSKELSTSPKAVSLSQHGKTPPRKSTEILSLSTTISSKGTKKGLPSHGLCSLETFAENECTRCAMSSSPRELKQTSSPKFMSPSKATQYPVSSGKGAYFVENSQSDSLKGSGISDSKPSREYLDCFKSLQMPLLSILPSSKGAEKHLPSLGASAPGVCTEKETVQHAKRRSQTKIKVTSPLKSSCRESIQRPDFCDSKVLKESLIYSIISGPCSIKESLEATFIFTSASSKEDAKGLPSSGLCSPKECTENEYVPFATSTIQFPSDSVTRFMSVASSRRESIKGPNFCESKLSQESLDFSSISESSSTNSTVLKETIGLTSYALHSTEECTETERVQTAFQSSQTESKQASHPSRKMLLDKTTQYPSFSSTTTYSMESLQREAIPVPDVSDSKSLREFLDLPVTSRLNLPEESSEASSEGAEESSPSSGLYSSEEYAGTGSTHSILQISQTESKQHFPPSRRMSLSQSIQKSSLSIIIVTPVESFQKEFIQDLDAYASKSSQEPLNISVSLETIEIPLPSRRVLENIPSSDLKSVTEITEKKSNQPDSLSLPMEPKRFSILSGLKSLSRALAFSSCSSKSRKEGKQNLCDSQSVWESLDFSNIPGQSSKKGTLEIPVPSTSTSPRGILEKLQSSNKSNKTSNKNKSSSLENKEKGSIQSDSLTSPRASDLSLLHRATAFPSSSLQKELLLDGSKRNSTKRKNLCDSKSIWEYLDYSVISDTSSTESLKMPLLSISTSSKGALGVFPSSSLISAVEIIEKKTVKSEILISPRECKQVPPPSFISPSNTIQFFSSPSKMVLSVESSQTEFIQGSDVSISESLQEPLAASVISKACSTIEYSKVPVLFTLTSPKGLPSSSLLSPTEITEKRSIQSDIPALPRESEQVSFSSNLILPSKPMQSPSSSVTNVYFVDSSWIESIQNPDVSDSKLLQEPLNSSIISGPNSTKENLEVPILLTETSSKRATKGLPTSGLRSPTEITEKKSVQTDISALPSETKHVSLPSDLLLPDKPIQFPSSSGTKVYFVDNSWLVSTQDSDVSDSKPLEESPDFYIISGFNSTKEELLSISPSSKGATEGLLSSSLRSPIEIIGEESVQSDTPSSPRESKQVSPSFSKQVASSNLKSLSKATQFPSFENAFVLSMASLQREPIHDPEFSESISLRESLEPPVFSGSSSAKQSLKVPLISTSLSSKGTQEQSSFGLRSIVEMGENENAQYATPSSAKDSKKASLSPSLMSLSKDIQFPSFSGPTFLIVPSSPRETNQAQDFSVPNSLQDSFDFSIFSRPSSPGKSIRESLEVPPLSRLTSSKGSTERLQLSGLHSPIEFAKNDSARPGSPSSPRESAQPSPTASPRLLNKTLTYPYFSGPSTSKYSMEDLDFSVPSSHKETLQTNLPRESFEFLTIPQSSSIRQSTAGPSLYTSSSSRISSQVLSSSGRKSPKEHIQSFESAHSSSPSSPKGSRQPSPIGSPSLLKKPMPNLFSGPSVLKQPLDVPSSSMSSSRRESIIHGPPFSFPNSLRESFEFPIIPGASSTRESLEVPLLSISSPSRRSKDFLSSFDLRSPAEYSESKFIHSSRPSSPRGSGQPSPATSPRLLKKSVAFSPFPGPVVPHQSTEVSPFVLHSQKESFDFPFFSGPFSTRESINVPTLFVSNVSEGVTEVLPTSNIKSSMEYEENEIACYTIPSSLKGSTEPPTSASCRLLNKSLLFPPFLEPGISKQPMEGLASSTTNSQKESTQDPALSDPNSLRESIDVLPVSTFSSSRGATEVLPSSGIKLPIEFEGLETVCSSCPSFPRESAQPSPTISPRLASKSLPLPPFSGTDMPKQSKEVSPSISSSRRESIQEPGFFGSNSLGESFNFLIIPGPSSVRESLDIPPLSISTSLKGSTDSQSSSGLRSPIEYSERERAHSGRPNSPKEPIQASPTTSPNLVSRSMQYPSLSGPNPLREVPQVSLTSSLTLLSETMQLPSFSGPSVSKESTEVPASMSSPGSESIQGSVFSIPNSLRESFEFPIFSGLRSVRESLEVPPLSTTGSLRESTHISPAFLRSPTEHSESENAHSVYPSSPRESIQPSPASSPGLLSKTFQLSSFQGSSVSESMKTLASSMSSSQKESRQGPDFFVPTSMGESLDIPIFSESSSIRESLEVPPCSSSGSSKDSKHVLPSLGLRSPIEYADSQSALPASPRSPRESKKSSPPFSPKAISTDTQVLSFSDANVTKESTEFPDVSVSSSQKESIQEPVFFDSNSPRESFDFPIFSGENLIRQSLEVPFFSSLGSLRGSIEVLPPSGLRSPVEYIEHESAYFPRPSSPRESGQSDYLSRSNLVSRSMQFPSLDSSISEQSMEVLASSMLSSHREFIEDSASSASKSLREAFEFPLFSGSGIRREILEVPPPFSTKESLQIIPISELTSVKEPEESEISAAVSQHSVSDFTEALAPVDLRSRREFTHIYPPLIPSHPQEFPEGLPLPSIDPQREFIQAPSFSSQSSLREYMDVPPANISQRQSIQMSASSQTEFIQILDFSNSSSQRESIALPTSRISAQRQSIQVCAFSIPSPQSESIGHPSSSISSQREAVEVSASFSPSSDKEVMDMACSSIRSQRKFTTISDPFIQNSQRESTGQPPSSIISHKESISVSAFYKPSSEKIVMNLSHSSISSQRKSIKISDSSISNSLRESRGLPPTSISYQREPVQVSDVSSPNSQRETMDLPSSSIISQRELIQDLVSNTPTLLRGSLVFLPPNIRSQTESIELPDSSTQNSQRQSMGLISSNINFQRDSIQIPDSSNPNLQGESLDIPPSSISLPRKLIHEFSPRTPSSLRELPGLPPPSSIISQRDFIQIPLLYSPCSLKDGMDDQSLSIHSQKEPIQDSSGSSSQRESVGFSTFSISSQRESIQITDSTRPNLQKESMGLLPSSIISQKQSIQVPVSYISSAHRESMGQHPSSISSQRESIQDIDSYSPTSKRDFIYLPPSKISSQKQSIQVPVSYNSSSERESMDFSFSKMDSQRGSIQTLVPFNPHTQRESVGQLPSTTSSQREYVQFNDYSNLSSERGSMHLPPSSITSQRESIQIADSSSTSSQKEPVELPSSRSSIQKESIQIPDASNPNSQAEIIEVLPFTSPISQRETIEVSTSLVLNPSEEFMSSPLSPGQSSPKDFLDVLPLASPASSEFVNTPFSSGQSSLKSLPLSVPVASEEIINVSASLSPNTTENLIEIPPFLNVLPSESIQDSLSSESSSLGESAQVSALSSEYSLKKFFKILPFPESGSAKEFIHPSGPTSRLSEDDGSKSLNPQAPSSSSYHREPMQVPFSPCSSSIDGCIKSSKTPTKEKLVKSETSSKEETELMQVP